MNQKEIWELTAAKAEMMKGKKFFILFQQKGKIYNCIAVFESFKNFEYKVDHFIFRVKNRLIKIPYVFLLKMVVV
ncbi:hypothetical protein AS361_03785 [Myroides marinus]|uniref:hypothetical protein n=1 Tax=Myroides marinus TaxID=703342 RepID=UPI000741DAA5|nr:hypothetical protein [Myroides marinus]KUF38978.1 hypothetical protein AS361_03785 [Myroides marinus]